MPEQPASAIATITTKARCERAMGDPPSSKSRLLRPPPPPPCEPRVSEGEQEASPRLGEEEVYRARTWEAELPEEPGRRERKPNRESSAPKRAYFAELEETFPVLSDFGFGAMMRVRNSRESHALLQKCHTDGADLMWSRGCATSHHA